MPACGVPLIKEQVCIEALKCRGKARNVVTILKTGVRYLMVEKEFTYLLLPVN